MDKHPLLINEVLHNIFGRLDTKDLMQCRQVCQLWNKISAKYVLDHMKGTEIEFTSKDTENPSRISKYLEMLEDENSFRYQRFYFDGADMKNPLVMQLFNTTGENITGLKLLYDDPEKSSGGTFAQYMNQLYDWSDSDSDWTDCDSVCESDSSDSSGEPENKMPPPIDSYLLYQILFEKCPNLKRLALGGLPGSVKQNGLPEGEGKELGLTHISIRQRYRTTKYSRLFFLDLFKACPNLIDLRFLSDCDSLSQEKLVVDVLMETGRAGALKVLQLHSIDDESHLDSCLQNSHLEKLKINMAHVSGETFTNLMANLSSTLHTLTINVYSTHGFNAAFPVMENLRKLNLGSLNDCVEGALNFERIDYVQQFPNLIKLGMSKDANNFNLDHLFSPYQNPHNNLEELELPCAINNPTKIKQIAKLFPNVIKLNMSVQTDITLQEIWTGWPKLEELLLCVNFDYHNFQNIDQNIGLDSLLTGIPTELCQNILKNKSFDSVDVEKVRVAPSILNLKRLKKLFIHSGPNITELSGFGNRSPDDMVTDVSGYFAFSKLPSLTSLTVCMGSDDISLDCRRFICSQLGLTLHSTPYTSCTKVEMKEKAKPIKKWHSTTGHISFSFVDLLSN